jgi:hypothetical protein
MRSLNSDVMLCRTYIIKYVHEWITDNIIIIIIMQKVYSTYSSIYENLTFAEIKVV